MAAVPGWLARRSLRDCRSPGFRRRSRDCWAWLSGFLAPDFGPRWLLCRDRRGRRIATASLLPWRRIWPARLASPSPLAVRGFVGRLGWRRVCNGVALVAARGCSTTDPAARSGRGGVVAWQRSCRFCGRPADRFGPCGDLPAVRWPAALPGCGCRRPGRRGPSRFGIAVWGAVRNQIGSGRCGTGQRRDRIRGRFDRRRCGLIFRDSGTPPFVDRPVVRAPAPGGIPTRS